MSKLFSQDIGKTNLNKDDLLISQISLSPSLLTNIRLLGEEIKHTWPDAGYYRETVDFGKLFPALEAGRLVERAIPDFIEEARNQICAALNHQMKEKLVAKDYDNCIITIYQQGNGIDLHIDRNFEWAHKDEARKYYFGESILGMIVEPDSGESLYFEHPEIGEKSRFYLEEKSGTIFLFRGCLRNEWKHGVLPVARERISMTFRKVIQKSSILV